MAASWHRTMKPVKMKNLEATACKDQQVPYMKLLLGWSFMAGSKPRRAVVEAASREAVFLHVLLGHLAADNAPTPASRSSSMQCS